MLATLSDAVARRASSTARRSHHSPDWQVSELEQEYRTFFESLPAAFKEATLDARDA